MEGVRKIFIPQRIFFEKEALNHPLGEKLFRQFKNEGKECRFTTTHNRVRGIPGTTPAERFHAAKRTLVIGVRKTLTFPGCRPSADFQLPLATGCAGECQYCYLHTTLGALPYLRIYVNIEEILDAAGKHLSRRLPAVTVFEGSATSDPLTIEHYSGSLERAILFFSRQEKGAFRFATKQVAVESLLELEHRGKTHARFSLNAEIVARQYEKGVPSVQQRMQAALKMKKAGYPVGFLIAPVIIFPGWKTAYRALLEKLADTWPDRRSESAKPESDQPIDAGAKKNEPKNIGSPAFSSRAGSPHPEPEPNPTFEIIAHRFTSRAKKRIRDIFPATTLPLDEEERRFKYGQFGYGKYVYPPDVYAEIKEFFTEAIDTLFPEGQLDYIV